MATYRTLADALEALQLAERDVLDDHGPDALEAGRRDLVVQIADGCTYQVAADLLRRHGYAPRARRTIDGRTSCCTMGAVKRAPRRADRSGLLCAHDILRSQCAECAVASGAYTWTPEGEMVRVTS